MQFVLSKDGEIVRHTSNSEPVLSLDYLQPPPVPPSYNGTPIPTGAQWLPLHNDGFSLFDADLAPIWHLRGEPQFKHCGDSVARSYPALNALRVGRA